MHPQVLSPSSRAETKLRIAEIFLSLQGETSRVGLPTTFVRLTGCPLRCDYCDTAYAFHGGNTMSLTQVMNQVRSHGTRYVTVTGGEPLAQKSCIDLLIALCDAGYDVSLETSGAIDIAPVDRRVSRIVDLKTPGSGELARNLWTNMEHLNAHDEVKFVVCDRADYEWSREKIKEYTLSKRCPVLLSPSHGQVTPRELAEWILADGLDVRMQIQLHKLLWGDAPGH